MERAVQLTHNVAEWNKNRTFNRRITCITDDADVIKKHVSQPTEAHLNKNEKLLTSSYGITWMTRGNTAAVWFKPGDGMFNAVETIAHELAHVVTAGSHGYTWRRMVSLLTPLIVTMMHPTRFIDRVADDEFILNIIRHNVRIYRKQSVHAEHFISLDDEVRKMKKEADVHFKATKRCMNRFLEFTK